MNTTVTTSQERPADIVHHAGGTSISGEAGVNLYRAAVIKSGISFYLKTGMKVNSAYKPTNMLAAASQITGKDFKRGQLQQAHDALKTWIDEQKASGAVKIETQA